jgi:predicted aspartyl protease
MQRIRHGLLTAAVALAWVAGAAAGDAAPTPQAQAQAEAAPPVTALPDLTVSAPEPRYVAPTTRDRIGRIWAPVLINGQGPYRLVLDTGASRSAITERVASKLDLPVYKDSVRLRGVTGTAIASTV